MTEKDLVGKLQDLIAYTRIAHAQAEQFNRLFSEENYAFIAKKWEDELKPSLISCMFMADQTGKMIEELQKKMLWMTNQGERR